MKLQVALALFGLVVALASVASATDYKAVAREYIDNNDVVVFSKSYCPYCRRAKEALTNAGIAFKAVELDQEAFGPNLQSALQEMTGQRTVPNIWVKQQFFGGSDKTVAAVYSGEFQRLLGGEKAEL